MKRRALAVALLLTQPAGIVAGQELSFRAGPGFLSNPMLGAWLGYRPGALGPLAADIGVMSLGSSDGTRYGLTLDAVLRLGVGPYLAGGVAGGFGAGSAAGDWGSWSAGLGWDLLQLPFRLGVEARYRVLTDPRDTGIELTGRIAIPIGRSVRRTTPPSSAAPPAGPLGERPGPVPAEGAALTVVETALGAMGTPYLWGGTDQNGFDCSGLIQHAYAQAGIPLPRRGVDQAQAGVPVVPRLDRLRPGDILGFAESGREVTHVGLYLGDGEFIHSSSRGVRRSRLSPQDPEGRWWEARWVSARRVIAP